jgi:osmotically-inducible protein OsmY
MRHYALPRSPADLLRGCLIDFLALLLLPDALTSDVEERFRGAGQGELSHPESPRVHGDGGTSRMPHTDDEILSTVNRVLIEDSRVDEKEIEASVRDGVVTLRGAVDSAKEKRAARQNAESVPGVQHVDDQMTVANFVQRTDEELVEEVKNALRRDAYVSSRQIEVYASGGEVRLDGTVGDYHEKHSAEEVAWWVPGVINVESLLVVEGDDQSRAVSAGETPQAT